MRYFDRTDFVLTFGVNSLIKRKGKLRPVTNASSLVPVKYNTKHGQRHEFKKTFGSKRNT